MLGVVLWSDASDRKAVIWCEDQGDLAYVSAADSVLNQDDFFDAGDLVQFDMHMHESTRRARNTQLVLESCGTTLTEVLKNRLRHDALSELEPKMVEVLPIAVRDATDTEPFEVDEYRMRG